MKIERNKYIFKDNNNIVRDRDRLYKSYMSYMFSRTQKMFKYSNLPSTIPARELELILQTNGCATFTKVKGEYYVFNGELGGKPNVYYLPTLSIVANPGLSYNATLTIDKDCVVIKNDSMYEGLVALNNRYANLLTDCDITIRQTLINKRCPVLIKANTDKTYQDALKFLKELDNGKAEGIITAYDFEDLLNTFDFGSKSGSLTEIIEATQYIKGHWYNELGLQSNFNMKRESISSEESSLNEDALIPLVDDMLSCREEGLAKVNEMYGLNIKVEVDSSRKQLRVEMQQDLDIKDAKIEDLLNSENPDTNKENIE